MYGDKQLFMLTFTPTSSLEQSMSADCVRTLKHLEGGHADMRWTCKPYTEPTVRWQCYNYCTTVLQLKYGSTTWLLTKQAMQLFFFLSMHEPDAVKTFDSCLYFYINRHFNIMSWVGIVEGGARMLGLPGWRRAIQGIGPPSAGYWGKPKWEQ